MTMILILVFILLLILCLLKLTQIITTIMMIIIIIQVRHVRMLRTALDPLHCVLRPISPTETIPTLTVPQRGDPKLGIRPSINLILKVTFGSLSSLLKVVFFVGAPFSDPPSGDGDPCMARAPRVALSRVHREPMIERD